MSGRNISWFLNSSVIEMSSSIENATLSLHPSIFKRLMSHCEDWMAKASIPDAMRAATKHFMLKLRKYESQLNSEFANLGLE